MKLYLRSNVIIKNKGTGVILQKGHNSISDLFRDSLNNNILGDVEEFPTLDDLFNEENIQPESGNSQDDKGGIVYYRDVGDNPYFTAITSSELIDSDKTSRFVGYFTSLADFNLEDLQLGHNFQSNDLSDDAFTPFDIVSTYKADPVIPLLTDEVYEVTWDIKFSEQV